MKNTNLFNTDIPSAVLAEVLGLIKQIEDKLNPYLISLTIEDRRRLPKLGDKRLAFVRKATEYALLHPQFLPAGSSVEDLQVDARGRDMLEQIVRPLDILLSKLDDTQMKVGSEWLIGCLDFADAVKGAAARNVDAAKVIDENLSVYFKKASRADQIDESPEDTGGQPNN